jgi:hypothetical protein
MPAASLLPDRSWLGSLTDLELTLDKYMQYRTELGLSVGHYMQYRTKSGLSVGNYMQYSTKSGLSVGHYMAGECCRQAFIWSEVSCDFLDYICNMVLLRRKKWVSTILASPKS